MKVGIYPGGENDDIDDLLAEIVNGRSHGTMRVRRTQKMAPMELVSIAVRIRRSMMLSVPKSVNGQTVAWWMTGMDPLLKPVLLRRRK